MQAALAELVYSAELHGVVVAPQLKGLWLEVLLLQARNKCTSMPGHLFLTLP